MIWLLDTNVLIHAQHGVPPGVRARLAQPIPDDVVLGAVTIAELWLWYGAAKHADPAQARGLEVVTANIGEFRRVPGLEVED